MGVPFGAAANCCRPDFPAHLATQSTVTGWVRESKSRFGTAPSARTRIGEWLPAAVTDARIVARGQATLARFFARRPSVARCCWSRRRRRWCGRTRRGRDSYHAVSDFHFGPEVAASALSLRGGPPTACWRSSSSSSDSSSSASSSRVTSGTRRAPRCRSRRPSAGWSFRPPSISGSISRWDRRDTSTGWAVPIATDIAFALAVLAVLSTHLPPRLRTFLLTLAVVDDLLAITVIAVFYTDHLSLGPAGAGARPGRVVRVRVQRGVRHWWLLVPLAVAAWALVHASGVHATVAGVLLGFAVPVLGRPRAPTAELFEHTAAAGVGGIRGTGVRLLRGRRDGRRLVRARRRRCCHPVTVGVIAGLVIGKPLGVFGYRIPAGQIHPCQPRRRPRVARRARRLAACWDRVHSFVTDR